MLTGNVKVANDNKPTLICNTKNGDVSFVVPKRKKELVLKNIEKVDSENKASSKENKKVNFFIDNKDTVDEDFEFLSSWNSDKQSTNHDQLSFRYYDKYYDEEQKLLDKEKKDLEKCLSKLIAVKSEFSEKGKTTQTFNSSLTENNTSFFDDDYLIFNKKTKFVSEHKLAQTLALSILSIVEQNLRYIKKKGKEESVMEKSRKNEFYCNKKITHNFEKYVKSVIKNTGMEKSTIVITYIYMKRYCDTKKNDDFVLLENNVKK